MSNLFKKNKTVILWTVAGGIFGFFLLHPGTHAITEFFHLHKAGEYHLHLNDLFAGYIMAFNFKMWPHWITYTLLGGFVGYLLGKKIEGYRLISEYGQRFQMIGKQASAIIHDLNNPLAVIKGNVQLIKEDIKGTETEKDCNLVIEETNRLESMVESIKVAVKGDFQKSIVKTSVNLKSYLEKIVNKLKFDSFVDVTGDESVMVAIDENYFERVVWNIIKNSKESFENSITGKVTVEVKKINPKSVSLVFKDNGPGIPQEDAHRLFEFGTSIQKSGGAGIGLYNCRKIVEAHGGTVKADSKPANGMTITVNLPAYEEQINYENK